MLNWGWRVCEFLPSPAQLVLCWEIWLKGKPKAILINRGKNMNLCPSTQISQVGGVHSPPPQTSGVPKHPKDQRAVFQTGMASVTDWCQLHFSPCCFIRTGDWLCVPALVPPCPLVMKSQGHVRLSHNCVSGNTEGQIISASDLGML